MLEVLRRLIQDVNAADALEEALVLIVAQVGAAMQTNALSIFTTSPLKIDFSGD